MNPSRRGCVVWLTGLPSSGKSTIAKALSQMISERGQNVEVLDGDEVRENLSKGLGFSKEDRDTNVRRIGFVAHLLARNGVIAITAAISPYRQVRDEMRKLAGDFVEVYVATPLEVCEKRDVKGLYAKSKSGGVNKMTGHDDPYEPPLFAEVEIDTTKQTPEQSAQCVFQELVRQGFAG